jgi:hypothetical protein
MFVKLSDYFFSFLITLLSSFKVGFVEERWVGAIWSVSLTCCPSDCVDAALLAGVSGSEARSFSEESDRLTYK